MSQIRSITELRKTTELSKMCHKKNKPVFITKNSNLIDGNVAFKNLNKNKGFSLIELIIVIVIIGILWATEGAKLLGTDGSGQNTSPAMADNAMQAAYLVQLNAMVKAMQASDRFNKLKTELNKAGDDLNKQGANRYLYTIDGFNTHYDTVKDTTIKVHSNGWYTQAGAPVCDETNQCNAIDYIYSLKNDNGGFDPANINYYQKKGCAIYVHFEETISITELTHGC